ncbi:unnamed protein product, partial [Brenthis ino]
MKGKIMLIALLALLSITYSIEGTIRCGPYMCRSNQSCVNRRCVNPCDAEPCGDNANCDVLRHLPECTCRPLYTGNPYVSCRLIEFDE